MRERTARFLNRAASRLARSVGSAVICLSLAAVAVPASAAETWPSGPLTMVVPFKAGGSIDRLARVLGPALAEQLGTEVHIENRDGANGQIGYTQVFAGPDDGSMFVLGVEPYLSNSILKTKAPYSLDSWAFLAVQENDPVSITVLKDSPYNTLGELIEAIRKNPDTIRAGVSSASAPQLQLIAIRERLGNLPYREVTYNGTEYRNALLGGHVDFMMSSASGDLAMDDQVKVLAIASDESFPGWEKAQPINTALAPYGAKVPYIGAIRFVAFKSDFKEKHPDRWEAFKAAYAKAVNSPGYQDQIKKSGQIVVTRPDPFKNAREIIEDNFSAIREFGK